MSHVEAISATDIEASNPVPCGDERTRTADPLLAKQVLYQLSYVPGGMQENPPRVQHPSESESTEHTIAVESLFGASEASSGRA